MYGREVTCEAMSTTAARSRRHWFRWRFAPAASQFKCRTTLKRTRPLSPRPPPNLIELPLTPAPLRRGAGERLRNVQQFAFSF